jgi:RNA polymerase sigma factor (TIGR02999 family)
MPDNPAHATQALEAHVNGDPRAADELLPLVYDRLRALASRYMQGERPDHTLQPTALVHEAYLRLIDNTRIDWNGRTHFFAVAATQMRRILSDHARRHRAQRRGGRLRKVMLDSGLAVVPNGVVGMVALDESLERLAHLSRRQSRVVELRVFAGLTVEETAHVLGVSPGTVKGDWRVARAWLARELSRS